MVREVFAHYLTVWPKPRYSLTRKRAEKIRARVREFGADAVKLAISNTKLDTWVERPKQSGLEILLRSEERCEYWLNFRRPSAAAAASFGVAAPATFEVDDEPA